MSLFQGQESIGVWKLFWKHHSNKFEAPLQEYLG